MKKTIVLLAALFVCAAAYVPCRAQYISGYADLSDSDVTKTLKNHILRTFETKKRRNCLLDAKR